MDQVKTSLPQLCFPMEKSIFPGVTVNFGGRVATYCHRDTNNLAYGMCAITPLGQFDPSRSAQLVLEEAKLIIEVPSAATAFIMSAPCTHSNLPIAEGDTRVSFTQYAAGPIFHYVQNQCMTEETLNSLSQVGPLPGTVTTGRTWSWVMVRGPPKYYVYLNPLRFC